MDDFLRPAQEAGGRVLEDPGRYTNPTRYPL